MLSTKKFNVFQRLGNFRGITGVVQLIVLYLYDCNIREKERYDAVETHPKTVNVSNRIYGTGAKRVGDTRSEGECGWCRRVVLWRSRVDRQEESKPFQTMRPWRRKRKQTVLLETVPNAFNFLATALALRCRVCGIDGFYLYVQENRIVPGHCAPSRVAITKRYTHV